MKKDITQGGSGEWKTEHNGYGCMGELWMLNWRERNGIGQGREGEQLSFSVTASRVGDAVICSHDHL